MEKASGFQARCRREEKEPTTTSRRPAHSTVHQASSSSNSKNSSSRMTLFTTPKLPLGMKPARFAQMAQWVTPICRGRSLRSLPVSRPWCSNRSSSSSRREDLRLDSHLGLGTWGMREAGDSLHRDRARVRAPCATARWTRRSPGTRCLMEGDSNSYSSVSSFPSTQSQSLSCIFESP